MQSSICKLHNQKSHDCFPLHNIKPLLKTPSLPQQIVVNSTLALHRRQVDNYWSWFYKLIFGFYTNLGEYLATYGRRNSHGPPPRDLAATKIVINYALQDYKYEQS